MREIAASNEDGVACYPLRKYQLTILTADVRGAGTDGQVSVVLYGEQVRCCLFYNILMLFPFIVCCCAGRLWQKSVGFQCQ